MNYYRIKRELERRNISIRSISKNIGVTEQGLHQMIRNGSMKISVLEEISKFLDVDIAHWFEDDRKILQVNEDTTKYQKFTEDNELKCLNEQLTRILFTLIQRANKTKDDDDE